MKKLSIIFALTTFTVQALAALPNTFIAGTPAKASEVNENFDYLDTKIDAACEDKQDTVANTYTYTANNLASGSVLNLITAGQAIQYKMLTFPIYDHSTGKRYAVKIPYNGNVSIGIYNTNAGCSGSEIISGFPAVIYPLEMQEISRADNGSFIFTKSFLYPGIAIKVGSTKISLGLYNFESSAVTNGTDNGTPFDLTDDITAGVQSTRMTASIAEIDAFIDYIVITEI